MKKSVSRQGFDKVNRNPKSEKGSESNFRVGGTAEKSGKKAGIL